ncbi:MAG: DUF4056 domain-containing protein [Planctomycetota bacterium]|jgi:hypothetical protein
MNDTILVLLVLSSIILAGCSTGRGYEWGHTGAGTFDEDPFNLAPFGSPLVDGNGIVYTLRCGTIDPDHVYGWARKTKSYYDALYDCLTDDRGRLSTGCFKVSLTCPDAWRTLPPSAKKQAAHEMAIEAAQYLAFNDGLWHEMATWYGHRTFPLISDFESALSWEDVYSDRLGTVIAAEAIAMGGDFNANVTMLTRRELKKRQLVDTARAASITKTMENVAYREDPFAKKILWRNLDIGTGDDTIDPVVFPGFTSEPPIPLPAPTLDVFDKHDIKADIVVSPLSPAYRTITSKADIRGHYIPSVHNPKVLAVIKQDAIQRGFRVFD